MRCQSSCLLLFSCLDFMFSKTFMPSLDNLNTNSSSSTSVYAVQNYIGHAIGDLLSVAVMFLGVTSLGGAFVSGCPFRSAFSGVIRLTFDFLQTLSQRIHRACLSSKRLQWLWIGIFTLLWVASTAVVAYAGIISGPWFLLFFIPAVIPIAYSARQEVAHKPQKCKVSCLATWAFFFVSLSMIFAFYFPHPIYLLLYGIGVFGIVFACWMISRMSKSMADTGEIDAIAWLLITTPQYPATFFKKAGQLVGFDSIGHHYRPRLLESLMPLLAQLIASYHTPEHHSSDSHSPSSKPRRNKIELRRKKSDDVLDSRYGLPTSLNLVDDDTGPIDEDPHLKNLEIYIACLARLSEFTDYEGSFWCLWEDAMLHPKLEQPLIDKLVVFANPRHDFHDGLRSAATKVLNNYELDIEGKPVWSVSTVLRSAVTLMLNVNGINVRANIQDLEDQNLHRPADSDASVEPAHSSGEIEEVRREIGDFR